MESRKHVSNDIKVVGICGSLRQGSYTRQALRIALNGAEGAGVQSMLIDLRDYQLPFCAGKEDETVGTPDVLRLKQDVGQAHGIILGTPEYHGSFSGVLKNALDLMGFNELEGKMIGLVGVSGGALGAHNALNSLRTIGRSLHAWVIPEQVSIARAWQAFNPSGQLKDSDLENRVRVVGRQVARFAYLHSSDKSAEFIKAWEGAHDNPGGRLHE